MAETTTSTNTDGSNDGASAKAQAVTDQLMINGIEAVGATRAIVEPARRLTIERLWTTEGIHPYDAVTWERRDVVQSNWKTGDIVFEQLGVEFPDSWSVNAATIVTTKYFRGAVGQEQREWSLRQLIDRVVNKYVKAGIDGEYFATDADAEVFGLELTHMLLHKVFSFNSPVWFNVGTPAPQQVSACFILSVDDTMDSILNWYREEGMIFKGGSGAGLNLSRIRSSKELLSSGGTASGPVSFMRGADASAGTIKSGGATRRAAKMVVLDVNHPDIVEFVETKVREEDKIRALRDAGFDMDLGGSDITSVQYQNANNSVRVSDEFMQAVDNATQFNLTSRADGSTVDTIDAKGLFRQIAEAAWACADPGIQYDDTINDWHTNPETGRITASNPCCFVGETLVLTSEGPLEIEQISKNVAAGQSVSVHAYDTTSGTFVERPVRSGWVAGQTDTLVEVTMRRGTSVTCTPEHRFLAANGEWIEAQDLQPSMDLQGRTGLDQVSTVRNFTAEQPVDVYDIEVDGLHNFVVASPGAPGVVAHNSEYMSLDNSSCNLASLNLMKFLGDDGVFNAPLFRDSVELVITAMEVSISFADFPTPAIGATTRAYRQLGIGYANLGALLMATGHAYDSDSGRAFAAAITSLMTATSYRRSAQVAGVVGPYAGYARNASAHQRVMRKHSAACDNVRTFGGNDKETLILAANEWSENLRVGEINGWRNAQASVLAPTGTIGLMMDCDTTGVEPDLALVKMKKLVGGSSMKIVNHTVPRALRSLGYTEETVEAIVEHVGLTGTVEDAPGLRLEHYSVFDCALGDRAISPMGHVRMMAAVQPFISGAISKTVNMPEDSTVEEVEEIYYEGWKLGLKALAIYRDNCKVGQPLTDLKGSKKAGGINASAETNAAGEPAHPGGEHKPLRKRLPKNRTGTTYSFSVAGAEGYMTANSYPDNGLGEVFIKMSKQGSTLAGVMDAFSVAVSIALQHGVPLETYVSKFANMRFEPAGMTDDPDVRIAQSVMDYLFRRLALDHLPFETRAEMGIYTAAERALQVETGSYVAEVSEIDGDFIEVVAAPVVALPAEFNDLGLAVAKDAPLCMNCGVKMRPAGSCYVCESCGSTSGCS